MSTRDTFETTNTFESVVADLVHRSRKFSIADLAKESQLSVRTIKYILSGKTNITGRTLSMFEMAVETLEVDAKARNSGTKAKGRKGKGGVS